MTVVAKVSIHCEGPGYKPSIHPCTEQIGEKGTALDARRYAKEHGWRFHLGRDLCPGCQGVLHRQRERAQEREKLFRGIQGKE